MGERRPGLADLLRALPRVAGACWRLARIDPDLPLDATVARLRRAATGADHAPDPALARAAAALVERLLPLAPAQHLGPCLRRSLLLVDVLSRCGFSPVLRLGVRRGDAFEAHAWVSVPGLIAEGDRGYPSSFAF